MDGMDFFRNSTSEPTNSTAPLTAIGRIVVITVFSVALTLGILVAMRMVGAPPPAVDEIAATPIGF